MPEAATDRMVAPKQLIALINDVTQKREKIGNITQDLAERVKNAVDNGHLHKGAFSLMVRLHRMDEGKRNDFIRATLYSLDICEKELWGDGHFGDLAEQAEQSGDDESSAVDDQMKRNGDLIASGIKELPADAPDGKPKRGRPAKAKTAAVPVVVEHDNLEPFRQRGAAAFKIGKPGMIPTDLEGKKDEANAFLGGWSAASLASAQKREAKERGEPFEDDAESDRPSLVQNEKRETPEGVGTYQTH